MELINDYLLNSKDIDVSLPCDKCDGDCCGAVDFSYDEIISIFNKYNKDKKFKARFPYKSETILNKNLLFQSTDMKGIKITFKDKNRYRKLGLKTSSCIFKDNEVTGGCLIYNDRPVICKCYGKKDLLRCPYQNLSEQPKDENVKKKLINLNHKNNMDFLMNTYIFKGK